MNFFIGFSDFGTDGTKVAIEGEQRAVFVPRVTDVLDLTLKFIFAYIAFFIIADPITSL